MSEPIGTRAARILKAFRAELAAASLLFDLTETMSFKQAVRAGTYGRDVINFMHQEQLDCVDFLEDLHPEIHDEIAAWKQAADHFADVLGIPPEQPQLTEGNTNAPQNQS